MNRTIELARFAFCAFDAACDRGAGVKPCTPCCFGDAQPCGCCCCGFMAAAAEIGLAAEATDSAMATFGGAAGLAPSTGFGAAFCPSWLGSISNILLVARSSSLKVYMLPEPALLSTLVFAVILGPSSRALSICFRVATEVPFSKSRSKLQPTGGILSVAMVTCSIVEEEGEAPASPPFAVIPDRSSRTPATAAEALLSAPCKVHR
mmetsp:Transcript_14251/g.38669  ORF Transcript_14251/g.38669 Transcript_14251/m.38669 type:complete len:206 (-) Transcript_14251:70-687(-)